MFNPVRHEVNALFERLRDEAVAKAEVCYQSLAPAIGKINEIVSQAGQVQDDMNKFNVNTFSSELTDVKKRLERKSFFDGLDAQTKIQQISAKGKEYFKEAEKYFKNVIDSINVINNEIVNDLNVQLNTSVYDFSFWGFWIGGVICFFSWLSLLAYGLKPSKNLGMISEGVLLLSLPLSAFLGAIGGAYLGKVIADLSAAETPHKVNELEDKKAILEEQLRNLQRVSLP